MNKMKVKAMMKKPWWSYALLSAGIFLFIEGCSLLYGSDELSIQISVILFSLLMHGTSLGDLSKRLLLKGYNDNINMKNQNKNQSNKLLKDKACLLANVITQILLILIAILCYNVEMKITNILLFDICVVIIYGIVSVISYKFYKKGL